jgi:hypothetical protein
MTKFVNLRWTKSLCCKKTEKEWQIKQCKRAEEGNSFSQCGIFSQHSVTFFTYFIFL